MKDRIFYSPATPNLCAIKYQGIVAVNMCGRCMRAAKCSGKEARTRTELPRINESALVWHREAEQRKG